jgi:hypothetical protein
MRMIRRIGLLGALAGVAGVVLAVPSGASAAVTLGETFVPSGCSEQTYIQTASPPGGPSYEVPFDGVITQWSYRSDSSPPETVQLKAAFHQGGTTFQIVAESTPENIAASTLNTYQSRISVPAGADLGEFIGADCSRADDNYSDYYADGNLSPGTTSSAFTLENFQQDISAVLEPDADRDGYGDDTQDLCPTNAATQGPCPVSAPAKKKCKKKKKKHSAESAKKKKCKKKKKK